MAVYCVQAELAFTTAARRDAVFADLQPRVAGEQRWGSVDVLEPRPLRHGQFGIRLEARFVSQASADSLRTRVDSFATGVRTPIAGSWLRLHDCTHDEGANVCAVTAERVW